MSDIENLNPVVLITGSTRGLGLAYARHLNRNGFTCVLHDISEKACQAYNESDSIEALSKEFSINNRQKNFYFADLTSSEEVKSLVGEVMENFGRIDVLINNAGGDISGRDKDASGGKAPQNDVFIDLVDFKNVFERNFHSTFYMCQEVGRVMVAQKSGKIVNTASGSAGKGVKKETTYAVSKAAVMHLTRCLATQFREYNINVNCIAPGPTETGRYLSTRFADVKSNSKLDRPGSTQDLCNVIEFLSSNRSDFISGQVIRVDGGRNTTPI